MATQSAKEKKNEKGTFEKISNRIGNMMPSDRINAIDLLIEDHDKVRELFKKVKATDENRHPALFEKIKAELDVHTHIEETIFYPMLLEKGSKDLIDLVREGIEEHRQAKMFLREIKALSGDSFKFEPKLTVLIEDIEHHAKDEESEMFPLVKKEFEADVLEDIGVAMDKEKRSFKRTIAASAAN